MDRPDPSQARYHSPILADRIEARRRQAVAFAVRVEQALQAQGVKSKIFGSLARGQFSLDSDVDFLVTVCPADLRYAIEALVEDLSGGLSFDVVYLDEIRPPAAARAIEEACDAASLTR